jgi:hypothetical protein
MSGRQVVEGPTTEVWADTIPVTLGGVRKPIKPLAARPSKEWKLMLAERAQAVVGGLETRGNDWSQVLARFADLTDLQAELLVAYDHEGRLGGLDWILDNATEREIYEAFKAVLVEAFPPLADAQRFPQLLAGLLPQLLALSGNSPSASGDAPETSSS